MFFVSLCELTEGICRSLLSILMSTVSADNSNANGEAGWGGQHGAMSKPLVVLAGEGSMGLCQSHLWCLLIQRPCRVGDGLLAGLRRVWVHLPTKGWISRPPPLKPTLPH